MNCKSSFGTAAAAGRRSHVQQAATAALIAALSTIYAATALVLTLFVCGDVQAGDQAAAAASLAEILNPLDELQYWADMAGNPAMGKQHNRQ